MFKGKNILMVLLLVSFLSFLIIFSSEVASSCCDDCELSCDPCEYINCQEDYYSDSYCKDGVIYKDLHFFSCESGVCVEEFISQLVEECSYQCAEGNCVEEPGCSENSDCRTDYYGEDYCLNDDVYNNDVYNNFHDFSCIAGECYEQTTSIFHKDCGEDYLSEWDYYCEEKDVHRIREEITNGCELGKCINNSFWNDEFVEYCEYGCADGKCTDEPEEPGCYMDKDCSDNYYSDKYCDDDNVYRELHDFFCSEGSCGENLIKELVEKCSYKCENAKCIEEPEEEDDKNSGCSKRKYEEKDYCGDGFCDELNGEDEVSCYQDCKTTIKRPTTNFDNADETNMQKESQAIMLRNTSDNKENSFSITTLFIILIVILIIILVLLLIIKG